MKNQRMMILLIAVCLVLSAPTQPLSLQCKPFCPERVLEHRDVIFSGHLVEVREPITIKPGPWDVRVIPLTYRVSAIWKGPTVSEFTVYIDEHKLRNRPDHYKPGEHHFVVPWQPKGGPLAGELRISDCARTKLVLDAVVERFLLPDPIYQTNEYSRLPNATLLDYYRLLTDPDNEVSFAAASDAGCLRAYSDEMAPDLIALLRGSDVSSSLAVANALMNLGEAQAAIPTFEWALNSDETELRLAGFLGLRRAHAENPELMLPYLFMAFEDPDVALRRAAVNTLDKWQAMGTARGDRGAKYQDACCRAKESLFIVTQVDTDVHLRQSAARVFERVDSRVPCI